MKSALCISGQPRFLEKGYEHISKYIIEPNNCDVFIHAWYDKEPKNGWNTRHSSDINRPDLDKLILELYNPKGYIIEPQIENLAPMPYSYYKEKPDAPVNIQFSMFYTILMANKIKKDYESQHGKYDCVIRCRFDSGILSPLYVEKYSMNKLYYADVLKVSGAVNDWLNFSSSPIIDILCNTYHYIHHYHSEGVSLCGENMITTHLEKNKIITQGIPISLFLIRDKDFNDKSWYGKWWGNGNKS